jgi:hypothetical protein
MQSKPKTVITIIADRNFLIPVYVLVLSLKSFQPAQRIHILGISLSAAEKAFFTQFENVFVFDASIPRSEKPGAMRIIADILKGEALLTAKNCEEPWIALLDGDCIATGDILPYLEPDEPALYARARSVAEDDRIFQYYRSPGEPKSGIPERFLQRWRDDVGQRTTPVRTTTVLSGNLILHRNYLDFCEVWKNFMQKVLVAEEPSRTDAAYYMPAEFALSAWLMFADNPPPLREVRLNSNPGAYLAHLGPAPKYWLLWTRKNLPHFDRIICLLDWAEKQGYAIPVLPYALKKRNKPAIIATAFAYEIFIRMRGKIKQFYKTLAGNSPERQARRYGRRRI